MCRGADKRAVSRRQGGHVESDTTNCHSSPFRRGLGVGRESDGGSAATLVTSSRSGKGAPTGVLGAALRDGSQLLQSCQRRI